MSNKTKTRPPRTTAASSVAEDEAAETPTSMPSSEGGINLERFIARYEAQVGKLTTQNILLEDQLDGTRDELRQVKEALDELVARLPKSEPTGAPSNGQAAKKVASP